MIRLSDLFGTDYKRMLSFDGAHHVLVKQKHYNKLNINSDSVILFARAEVEPLELKT